MSGYFLTIEGGEGSGKSTLLKGLAIALKQQGIAIHTTREPGGTAGAEEIRALLVKGQTLRWDALSEVLLLLAARRQLIAQFIKPHLAQGNWVICDRFIDSTFAYQGGAGGVKEPFIKAIYEEIADGLYPHLTILLDIDPSIGLSRAAARLKREEGEESRFEGMSLEYHQKIRQKFLHLAQENPDRFVVLDACQPPEQTLKLALEAIENRLK